MGDSSTITVRFYDIPNTKAFNACAMLLEENYPRTVLEGIRIGASYELGTHGIGNVNDIAGDLDALGVSFVIWQDPVYEFDGYLVAHHKNETYEGNCDAYGTVHVAWIDARDAYTETGRRRAWGRHVLDPLEALVQKDPSKTFVRRPEQAVIPTE